MRVTQLRRRLLYFVFGALPASVLLYDSDLIPEAIATVRLRGQLYGLSFVFKATGAFLGTLGLWIALAVRLPASQKWHRLTIAVFMCAGLISALPWSILMPYLSVANAIDGSSAQELRTLSGKAAYLWHALFVNWLTLSPSIVALHYLACYTRRASNNRFDRDGGAISFGEVGEGR